MLYNSKSSIIILGILINLALDGGDATIIRAEDAATKKNQATLCEQWLSSVIANDEKTAIAIAKQLVYETSNASISQEYIKLAEREGIKPAFFTAPYGYWDFKLWRDALFFKQLLRDITKDDSNDIKAIFNAVQKHISSDEKGFYNPPWPSWIWEKGEGQCDRQAWVFCEIAYQGGWETQIIYLRDPKTKESPHTICEIRKGPELVWTADPYMDLLFPQKSTEDIADDELLLQSIWGHKTILIEAIQDSIFWTPSYPQDYRPYNQELYKILNASLKSRCPRFGTPPNKRLSAYKELRQKTIFDKPRFPMELWFYPFRLLKDDIIRHCMKYGIQFL